MAENSGQSLTAARPERLQMKWAFQNEGSLGLDSNGVCAIHRADAAAADGFASFR
jgi:hypothetical protein